MGHLLPLTDMALVMTVEPGFGGQKFQSGMIGKLHELREHGFTGLTEMDGGVSMDNIALLAENGLDVAVMGTAMYRSDDPARDMAAIHALRA